MPIEQIWVGDRVLAQDPQTGQLAYKPVLRTTIRPPVPLIKIAAGDESITCSGGHFSWVSGKGWVKARELEPGMRLHRVTGTRSIASVDNADAENTYNLIVADFHTYFVGDAKILTHDNTMREPTSATVPGLKPG